jgi:ABC-type sugar transport system substrate-binding protein
LNSTKLWVHIYGVFTVIGVFLTFLALLGPSSSEGQSNPLPDWVESVLKFLGNNIWWIVAITCLFAASLILSWRFRKYMHMVEEEKKKLRVEIEEAQPRKVALFVPRSNRSGYFWEQFEIEVIYSLSELGYYCCLAALNGDYIPENQIAVLNRFNWNEIQGAIIAPAGIEVLPDVAKRISEGRRVVLHDVTPETWRHYFVGEGLRAPDYVTVKNELGGRLAARIMKVYFETFGVEKTNGSYNVIYIPGGDRYPHSNERVSGFKSEWEKLSQYKVRPLPTPDGNWIASDARNACTEFLNARAQDTKLSKIDGIFACNDEMAFAAMHLLDSVKLDADIDPKLVAQTIIVGFDAIPLARSELKNKRSRFIATIDAKIEEQAQFVARYLGESIEQSLEDYIKRKTKPHEVTPKVLPNEMFEGVEPKGLAKEFLKELFRKEE